jgi:hypothetical protein
MKTTRVIIALACCAAAVLFCPTARAAFELIPPATDTNACVTQLASNKARIEFPGWRSSSTIATTDYAVIALKHVAAVQSVDSARVSVSGFPSTLFSFNVQASCSSEFTALFGSTATAFSDNPSSTVPAHTAAILKFNVTLKPGKTISDLMNDLATGTAMVTNRREEALGGSPVAGAGRSFFGSYAAATSPASCLQAGAVMEGCFQVSSCSGGGLPASGRWGYAAVTAAILGLGALALRRRTFSSQRPHAR